MSNIFVFAPTGSIGSHVADQLAKKGIHFKAAVRDAAKGETLKQKFGDKVEPVLINFYDQNSVDVALKGIEKVFLGLPPGQTLPATQAVANAAKKNGVKHVVKLAALGCENPDKFIWAGEHVQSDEMLKQAGLAVTSLRPSSFYSNFLLYDAATIKQHKKIFKAVADAPMNFIYPGDIAAVAVIALLNPGHENKDYYITGPDTLTHKQVAELFSAELGETIDYIPLDDATLREHGKAYLPTQEAIDAYSNMYKYFRDGYYNVQHKDLENLTGSKGKTLKEWIHENAAAFK
jgi:uncharacterized protein YbjT (DUF2867 family)